MSLAELFGLKETWRQRMTRARRDWLRARHSKPQHSALSTITHHPSPITRHFTLESLEPRLLLSAAPMEIGAGLSAVTLEHSPDSALSVQASALSSSASRHELVFIDADIQDRVLLASGINPSTEIVWLNAGQDGIEQISAALAGRQDLDAIHFVTHGSERLIKLGSTWLMQETLPDYAEQIQGWRTALADDADLLFYTCDLGSSEAGLGLLASIQSLTGADLATSTDGTGHAQYGADWDLEFQVGTIETGPLLGAEVQDSWTGLLDLFTVTNTNNSGNGSLREAILDAGAPGPDTIRFNIPGGGVQPILLTSALPQISHETFIDGYSQPGASPNTLAVGNNAVLLIRLSGQVGNGFRGLDIPSTGSTVQGLVINGFGQQGIFIAGTNNVIKGNFIGTNVQGDVAFANSSSGVRVGGTGNTIGGTSASARNVISGNGNDGIEISGVGADNNLVQGNYIGTNATGTAAVGNALAGVKIANGASNNTIGGTSAGARNVISGNSGQGIAISSTGNVVLGNFVGTNAAGDAAVGNSSAGIRISGVESGGNTIGGLTITPGTGPGNLISGNLSHGLLIENPGPTGNLVQGNVIGLSADGIALLGNGGLGGVYISGVANTIGGAAVGAGNVISGNTNSGVTIDTAGATGNVVQGNMIGTNASGTVAKANTGAGVSVTGGAANNTIGGTTIGARNVISGHNEGGQTANVILSGSGTTGNTVAGNYIGTDATGTVALTNSWGIRLSDSATGNTIGGTTVGAGNVISGNTVGIAVRGALTQTNLIQGNFIGTQPNGTTALANNVGILMDSGATGNVIGGMRTNVAGAPLSGAGNLISGNTTIGVSITGTNSAAHDNTVQGNYIGTDITGSLALPNATGVSIIGTGVTGNIIGGATPATGNILSGNSGDGLSISSNASGNIVQGNFIGTDVTGTLDLGNLQNGVAILSGASNNTIGGLTATPGTGAGNVISGNGADAIFISSVLDNTTVIQGNLIGLTADGTTVLGNARWGVGMSNGGARIGGTNSQARNVISANQIGITVNNSGSNNGVVIEGNYIGTDITGSLDRGNSSDGINVGSAPGTFIGGAAAEAGNVISGNNGTGIYLVGISHPAIDGLYNVAVQGNRIGLNAAGTAAVANGAGILITNANNRIGGTTAGARNTISGNTLSGVSIDSANSNLVQGNYIGTDVSGTADLGNTFGVHILGGASNNTIGGLTSTPGTGAGNVISGNSSTGILIVDAGATGNKVQGNLIGTNAAGTATLGNGGSGVSIINGASNNTIGGAVAGARNLISGNQGAGVSISSSASLSNIVQGNFIGTDVSGTIAIGNALNGIGSFGPGTIIGGTAVGAGNLISANAASGIEIGGGGSLIQGNLIGTKVDGTTSLGNTLAGVSVIGSAIIIGGTAAGAGNLIAFNSGDGVAVTGTATGNRIQGNSIHSNGDLGIDLANNGVTANDSGDGDTGPNNLQNVPLLTGAAPGSAIITGTLNSAANTTYTIEFFSNPAGRTVANAEGQTFLGRTALTTDASGNASFSVTLPAAIAVDELVTATATDPTNNTSEFSVPITVINSLVSTVVLNVTTNGLGTGRITSLPLGIDTTDPLDGFTESYPLNTLVTLTATPTDPDGAGPLLLSTFVGWSGAGISSTNQTLTLTMDQARTVTATFNLAGSTAAPPPVVNFVQGTSIFSRSLTISWQAPSVVPSSYLVYVGTQDGIYDPIPYFAPGNRTSLTLVNTPGVQHYFTVSAVYAPGILLGSESVSTQDVPTLEPLAAPGGQGDSYFVPRGASFQTNAATGVLANDTDTDGDSLTAMLVGQLPAAQGAITLNADGSFIFTPNPTFTGASVTFFYRVSAAGETSGDIAATITIAQESGQSQQASTTPLSGLEGWTVLDQGLILGPSNWAGVDPTYTQASGIDTPGSTVSQLGTLLASTEGLAQGRTDYRLTMNLTSTSTTGGALGVTFRYVDANNYYRFSMERDPNNDGNITDGYRRFIKMVNGTPTVLREQSATDPGLPPPGQWQLLTGPAYTSGLTYPVTLEVVGSSLVVQMRHPTTGLNLVNWAVSDPQFNNNGLALYSAGNAGSRYDLLSIASLENPSQVPLEVRMSGSGVGTVIGRVGTEPVTLNVPNAPVASYALNTVVTLTATPGSGSTFTGWTGPVTTPNPATPWVADVTLSTATIVTAQFSGAAVPVMNLDIDGNGQTTGAQDGIMLFRYLFGATDPVAITAQALSPNATRTPDAVLAYLNQARSTMLDVDGNGTATGAQDGIMLFRYLFGATDPAAITAQAIAPNALRTAGQIFSWLQLYDSDVAVLTGTATASSSLLPASAEPSALSHQLSVRSSLNNFALAEGAAVAATQLSSANVRSAPWVARFLGAEQDDDEPVVTLA